MPIIALESVDLVIDGSPILRDVTWRVDAGDRWIVIGPNGAGKTSMLRVAAAHAHPSSGAAWVMGRRLGTVDVRWLRSKIGYVSAYLDQMLRPRLTAQDAVVSALRASTVPARYHELGEPEHRRAVELLNRVGLAGFDNRSVATLSQGERQRVLIARALMPAPELVIVDEPAAGLDLAGRELLLDLLSDLAQDPSIPCLVMVTHHVEEIPSGFDRAALMAGGRIVAAGPIDDVIADGPMSMAYGVPLSVSSDRGRRTARLRSDEANAVDDEPDARHNQEQPEQPSGD